MKTIIFVLMLFLASTVTGQTIDLYKLTLNDSILCNLTIDQLTNMLGRPSAVAKSNRWNVNSGPEVFYHNKGLEFGFWDKKSDKRQRLLYITVHLTKIWDENYNEFYYPFPGKVFPNLDANMKYLTILPLFNNYPRDDRHNDWISVSNGSGYITIKCEELTKFLDEITIHFGDPQP